MARTTPSLLPRLSRLLRGMGSNIRRARLRRAHAARTVAEHTGITRTTLVRVERGDPAVSLGIYARVLQALGLEGDLQHLASDDKLGRKPGRADTCATPKKNRGLVMSRGAATVEVHAGLEWLAEPHRMGWLRHQASGRNGVFSFEYDPGCRSI